MRIGTAAALVVTLSATATAATGLTGPAAATGAPAGVRTLAGDPIPDEWKNRTSLRILPGRPRQNNDVRLFAHCPEAANHVIIGSTAFNLKGSTRLYREVGESLSDRGLARRSVSISYFALPGPHQVLMKCVVVTMNQKTRIRKIKVISRYAVPLLVRRFRMAQFFD
ncbi:hypothetical protein [Nonomuraea rosea]